MEWGVCVCVMSFVSVVGRVKHSKRHSRASQHLKKQMTTGNEINAPSSFRHSITHTPAPTHHLWHPGKRRGDGSWNCGRGQRNIGGCEIPAFRNSIISRLCDLLMYIHICKGNSTDFCLISISSRISQTKNCLMAFDWTEYDQFRILYSEFNKLSLESMTIRQNLPEYKHLSSKQSLFLLLKRVHAFSLLF